MAFPTRSGQMVGIPVSHMRWARIALWVQFVLGAIPFVAASCSMVGATLSPGASGAWTDSAAALLALGIYGYGLSILAVMALPTLLSGLVPILKAKEVVRLLARSRAFWWSAGWFVVLTLNAIAAKVVTSPHRGALLIVLPIVGVFLFAMCIRGVNKIAKSSRLEPLFSGLSATDLSRALQTPIRFGAGPDFPMAPREVKSQSEARRYAELARRRADFRLHVGSMTRVVAGAFIGVAGVWVFSGRPGPEIWMFAVLLGVVFTGFLIERRSTFYVGLAAQFDARVGALAGRSRGAIRRRLQR